MTHGEFDGVPQSLGCTHSTQEPVPSQIFPPPNEHAVPAGWKAFPQPPSTHVAYAHSPVGCGHSFAPEHSRRLASAASAATEVSRGPSFSPALAAPDPPPFPAPPLLPPPPASPTPASRGPRRSHARSTPAARAATMSADTGRVPELGLVASTTSDPQKRGNQGNQGSSHYFRLAKEASIRQGKPPNTAGALEITMRKPCLFLAACLLSLSVSRRKAPQLRPTSLTP